MMKNKLAILLMATICLCFALQPLIVFPSVHGAVHGTIFSKYSTNAPVLNGVIGASEWEDANVYLGVGDEDRFDVFLMHGEDFFYIGIRVVDSNKADRDRVAIFFDEGDDGGYGSGYRDEVLTDGQEDYAAIDGDETLRDGYYKSGYWYVSTAADEINFEAAIDYHVNRWEAEFKIPFVGEEGQAIDESDLNIDKDDDIGILIRLRDFENGYTGQYYYDEKEGDIETTPSFWLSLVFDDGPPTVSNVDFSPGQPGPDDAVTVTADVTDDVNVKDVILRYSIDGGGSWSDVPMTSGSAYTGTIPKQGDGITVQFKVVASDLAGFVTESAVSSYTVQAPGGLPAIPGFPLEAILIGIVIAAAALALFKKKQSIVRLTA